MGTFLKFSNPILAHYNTAEYLSFLRRFRALLPFPKKNEDDRPVIESLNLDESNGVPSLGISAELLAKLDQVIAQLTELNNQSRASLESAQLISLDKQRDNVGVYVLNRINRSSSLPLQAEREAGNTLKLIAKQYVGFYDLPLNQETETINGLLFDLRKADNAAAVQTLGLTPYLDELERLNNLYDSTSMQRSAARLANAVENSKIVRARGNEIYDDMTSLAFAWSLANPSAEATDFIRNVNALIVEAQTAYNQRKGQKKTGDDRPIIE